jgi:hypothetical protein
MNLPHAVKALLAAYAVKFPVPQGDPGDAHEERCRQWSIGFAEQCAYTFPDAVYGVKRATPDRPISKDSLANNKVALVSWDLLLSAGSGKPVLADEPAFHSIPEQIFVEVEPKNHLGAAVPVPVPTPTPTPVPVPCQCGEVIELLAEMRLEISKQHEVTLMALSRVADAASEPRPIEMRVPAFGGTARGTLKAAE